MAKRRLSKQQLRRIRDKQDQHLEALDKQILGTQQQGLITAHHGQQLAVENPHDGAIYRCYARSNLPALATGDQVLWRPGEESGSGVIEALLERRSVIERPHPHRGLKPIAANIDILAIVIAPHPEPFPNLIDRYLVAATNAHLHAILILNKSDLLDDSATFARQFSVYQALGYPLFILSATQQSGIEELRAQLRDKTSIFVGQSGVGKSSLLNCLLPAAKTKVGALSDAKAKGKHTTTAAQLFHIPSGGDIIDSPGIREFGLWHLDKDIVANGFIEFQAFLGECKYRDCQHTNPTNCAIQQAVAEKKITPERLASYFSIINSLDDN